ncbi:MAG: putative zinc-binding protein [Chloroflexi bacterium]|nr:putative zinc-binding protein [Chloroflexota bacterium]
MKEEQQWQAGINTHENAIFSCFGGASNTGITSGLACLEVVKELGLQKAAIMCLGGLPTSVKPVLGKTRAAKKIITVDGCPFECSRKIVEQAGFKPISIVLTRDIGMKKKGLSEDIGREIKGVMEYISDDEVKKAKELIVSTIMNE